jgi:hypothetical protein
MRKFGTLTSLGLLSLICWAEESVAATFNVISAEAAENATIVNPQLCSPTIGDGGSLNEAGKHYPGKCEGAGLPVEISGTHKYQKYLKFKTDTAYNGTAPGTRTELATQFFPFNQRIYIGFRVMIPSGVEVTNDFFYLLQMWQCAPAPGESAPPIAGIRIDRGTMDVLQFITRGDAPGNDRVMDFDLPPNVWHRFVIQLNVDTTTGGTAQFAVWNDEFGTPTVSNVPYGYSANSGTCNENPAPQHFRFKFGIYKGNDAGGNEKNKRYEVRFDDIRIGEFFDNVKPW